MLELLKDTKNQVLFALFAIFALCEILYPVYVGLVLLFAFIVFGVLSTIWKNKTTRFLALILLIALSLLNIFANGIKFGIDFSGGTRIPVILETSANEETMSEMLRIIKSRASVLGLTEAKVRAIGSSQIDVEIPGMDEALIKNIEDVLNHQGVFEGIVDGKIALNGNDILPGTIYSMPTSNLKGADWGVGFSVTKAGADSFAQTVKGKADYPLYMFLDRPNNASIFISNEDLKAGKTISDKEALEIANKALKLNGKDISLYILDNFDFNISANGTRGLISKNLDNETKARIKSLGFNLTEIENISPVIRISSALAKGAIIEEWNAIGLLSAPYLSADVTGGLPSYSYSISGSAQGIGNTRALTAQTEVKKIVSILKGGSLPVGISLGSRISIPAPLGQQFLQLSIFGILAAILAISLFVSLRYHQLKIILPILGVSIAELIILVSLLGSFTIDLAAMAGILAAIGVGVDAQIVITDELMKKTGRKNEEKLNHAFSIITTNVVVAVVAMVPILFSAMTEIIGFALSTIIGSLLGFMLSRPVYALLVERIIK